MSPKNKYPNQPKNRLVTGLSITAGTLTLILAAVIVILVKTVPIESLALGSLIPGGSSKLSQEAPFTLGTNFVSRGPWCCTKVGTDISLFYKGEPKYQFPGELSYCLLATDDGLYYTDSTVLYYCSFKDGKKTRMMEYPKPLNLRGMIGEKLYLATEQQDDMSFQMLEYDTKTNAYSLFDLPELWGDVAMVFSDDRLFYVGGRTDVSTRPVYEVDMDKKEAVQIDPSCGTGFISLGSKIYYSHVEPAGDALGGVPTLIELDTKTNNKRELITGEAKRPLIPFMADKYGIYMYDHHEGGSDIIRMDIVSGEKTMILKDMSAGYISKSSDGFYYSQYSSADGTLTLWEYNEKTGESRKLKDSIPGFITGVADGYIYYSIFNHDTREYGYYRMEI